MKKKILIYGIGSLQNKGCEALVNSTINQIPQDVEISLATFDYKHDKNFYNKHISKIVDHHRQDEKEFTEKEKKLYEYYKSIPFDYNNYEFLYQRDVINEMKKSDLSIHIGGDNYCYGVNEWMFSLNTKAKELNKKTVLWGASLFDEITDLDLINDLRKYDLLMLREKISYNAINKYIPEEKLMLIPDPAFSLKPQKIELNEWYKSQKKILGLNLSPLVIKTEENKNIIIKFINYILKHTDYSIVLLPHVTVEEVSDNKILKPIKEIFKNNSKVFLENDKYNCQEIKYIISKCDLLIAARTHASIAAYSSIVPTLVIGYSVKSRGIAENIFDNYKNYVIPIEDLNYDNILEKFEFIDKNSEKIKKILQEKMKIIENDAKNLWNKMCERLEILEKKHVCPVEKCVGCTSCFNICPVNAIELKENREGFLLPEINLDKCINCGMCRKHCPIMNQLKNKYDRSNLRCYAAKAIDDGIRKKSSSGGVFTYLAEKILSENGKVFGASFSGFKVSHIKIEKLEEIEKLRGSKYSESNLSKTFSSVKEELENKCKVLFSGTPCQILGLKNFLNKEYKNLYTVSVICHGVTNSKLLEKRIKELEDNFDSKMEKVNYRSKKSGWEKSTIEYQLSRINKAYEFIDDPLMYLYLNNFILRESCYNCPAKGLDNNIADIIIGDYWGIYNVHKEFYDNLGTSAVILKTEKGERLFNKIRKKLNLLETKYSNIVKYNPSFLESVKKPNYRCKIFNDLKDNTLSLIYQSCKFKINTKYNEKEINQDKENLINENKNLNQKLQMIYNSKRFKFIDKLGNLINKLK